MPTKRKRQAIIPDNLPAQLVPGDLCPGQYTAQALFDKEPDKYARIAQALAQGQSARSISRAEKVAYESIAVIMKREKESIEGAQKLTQGLNSIASQAVLLKLLEAIDEGKVPPGALGVTFGILRDKEKADLGQASQTIEVKKVATLDDVRGHLEALRKERDADIIEAEPA